MTNEEKARRIKEVTDKAQSKNPLELGYSNYKLCKAIPKMYPFISFIMAMSAVISGAALYLKSNTGFFAWFVVVTCGLIVTIMYYFLESWKKEYIPHYFQLKFANEYIKDVFTLKVVSAKAVSIATTAFGVLLTTIVLQDDSVNISTTYTADKVAIMYQVQHDTSALNTQIAEYRATNQIHINSTKTVLNPEAVSGLNALIESKSVAVSRGNSSLDILKGDKDKDMYSMYDMAMLYAIICGSIYVLFELLVVGSIGYVEFRDRAVLNWLEDKETDTEEEEEQEEEETKSRNTVPLFEKYPVATELIRNGANWAAVKMQEGVSRSTFFRIKREVA